MNRRTFLHSFLIVVFIPIIIITNRINIPIDSSSDTNRSICENKFQIIDSLKNKPINEIVVEFARSFLGVDYSKDPIEVPGKEHLVINLQALDCVTFYENSLVLARCAKKKMLTYDDFKREMQFVRYRGGIINDYPSRLHYTLDYFYDNEQKGVLKNITKEIGGVKFKKKINFMSVHPESYPKLSEHPEFIKAIQEIENNINARVFYYIPKEKVKNIESKILNGDILGITTTIEGLDCSHTGIAIWRNGRLHMIHAPSAGKKVQVTELPLSEYLTHIKKDSGIIVARPLEPKI